MEVSKPYRSHSESAISMNSTKLIIIVEMPSQDDMAKGGLLTGAAGSLLKLTLSKFGIALTDVPIFSVFPFYSSDVKSQLGGKATAIPGTTPVTTGKYFQQKDAEHLNNLYRQINLLNPNCILALGSTALWAMTGTTGLKKFRGTTLPGLPAIGGRKVFTTYHPNAVFKEWNIRPIFYADLAKLASEQEYANIRRPSRDIWIEPTIKDIIEFDERYIQRAEYLSIDIETSGRVITCIGFAPSTDIALVIPFVTADKKLYWSTAEEEIEVWRRVKTICSRTSYKAVTQNGLYDINHLWRNYGIPVLAADNGEDSMLLHHAMQPEMEKSLAFLGSIYTNEAAWKFMGRRNVNTIKKED